MNSEFFKDVTKKVINSNCNQQELSPGTPRRFEPTEGVGNLNKRIHKESRYADQYKNLPFSFRKPLKPTGRPAGVICNNCGIMFSGTTATVGIICSSCGKFSSVTEVI